MYSLISIFLFFQFVGFEFWYNEILTARSAISLQKYVITVYNLIQNCASRKISRFSAYLFYGRLF